MAEELDPKLEAIIDQAVRNHAREAAGQEGAVMDHPTVDALVDFQGGLLSGPEAEAVRVHLEGCPDCAEDLARLRPWDPAQPADPALLPSAEEIAVQRQRFEERLAEEGLNAGKVDTLAPVVPLRTPRTQRTSRTLRLPLAAALAVAALGVGFWLGSLWGISSEPAPRVAENPFFQTLQGDGQALRRSSGDEIRLPPGFDSLILRLTLDDVTPHEAYRAEMVNEAGKILHHWHGLIRQPNGSFLVTLPTGELEDGTYSVHLVGRDHLQDQVLSTFGFGLKLTKPE